MLECKICHKRVYSVNSFTSHVKASHKYSQHFMCGFRTCEETFDKISYLKKHLISKHNIEGSELPLEQSQSTEIFDENPPLLLEDNTDNRTLNSPCLEHSDRDSTAVTSFLTKFYSNSSVTRKFIQEVVEDTHLLISNILTGMCAEISPFISSLPENDSIKIKTILSQNPLENYLTEHKRFKVLEESENFIKPVGITLRTILDDQRRNNATYLGHKICQSQVVPIRETLKRFLELDKVFQNIHEYIEAESSKSDTISSIFTANLWRQTKKKHFTDGKIVLPIIMYFDDFECGNPLGSHAGIHKVGAVYFTLGGIPPEFSSRLENMFLWGLFHSTDRSTFGNSVLFSEFYKQLSNLESEGIKLFLNNRNIIVYFTLFLIIGDNLGMNSIMGLTESFSSNYCCRFCISSKEEMQNMTVENENSRRTRENYLQHVSEKQFGVKEYCIFNDLSTFHTTENLCCDVMHDLCEGVCRYDMAKVLEYFIYVKKDFSLDRLNSRIKYFDYDQSVDIGNRVPLIAANQIRNSYIVMSASEMTSFVVYFSILVGDLVDREDPHWLFYLTLVEIVGLAFKGQFDYAELNYFKCLIKEHNEMYISLFGENLKPKFHFLIHYPEVIKNVGPLNSLSSIRFEAFHKIGKTSAHVVTSRKNIMYTLALRYQLKLCYRLQLNIGLENEIDAGKKEIRPMTCHDQYCNIIIEGTGSLHDVDWVKFNGIYYKKKNLIQIGFDNEYPVYGSIFRISLDTSNNIFFCCKVVNVLSYDPSINAYDVNLNSVTNMTKCVNIKEISTPFSTKTHKISDGRDVISAC